jgi:hypothetical protein
LVCTASRFVCSILTLWLRLAAITCVIIPGLACAFVALGILFHIPRILATYACRALINLCWWHQACATRSRALRLHRRVRVPYQQDSRSKPIIVTAPQSEQQCIGRCCSLCRLSVYMSCAGELFGSGALACCKCGKRIPRADV